MFETNLNFEKINPQYVDSLQIETREIVILSIFSHQSTLKELTQLIKLYLKTFKTRDNVSLMLYLSPDCSIDVSSIIQDFNLDDSADIQILNEELAESELAGLYKLANYYLDSRDTLAIDQWILMAMMMNLPLIALNSPHNKQVLNDSIAFFIEDAQSLRDIIYHQQTKLGVRANLISQISNLDLAWKNDWEEKNLDYIVNMGQEIDVVTIILWGRSGSTLIHSLLDSHPQVLSIGSNKFASLMNFGGVWNFISSHQLQSFEQVLNLFFVLMHKEGRFSESIEAPIFSEENAAFAEIFRYYCMKITHHFREHHQYKLLTTHSRKMLFIIIHFAYALALGLDIRDRRLIVYQMHWAEKMRDFKPLIHDFPEVKIVGMLRSPIRGLFSLLAHQVNESQKSGVKLDYSDIVYSSSFVRLYRHILMGWTKIESALKEPVYGISLESLHKDPKKILKPLTKWLNISWDDSLLKSTIDGAPYSQGSGIHGEINVQKPVFDLERVNYKDWKEQFDELDQFILNGLLGQHLTQYKLRKVSTFQRMASKALFWMPLKLERYALHKALLNQNQEQIHLTILSYLERLYYTFLMVCGYSFNSLIQTRQTAQELLEQELNTTPMAQEMIHTSD